MSRAAEIAAFLAAAGWRGAAMEPLAQDASFRRYWRIRGGPHFAVLMDTVPGAELESFLRIGAGLAGSGLSVPTVLAADEPAGLLLLEDFGDALFPEVGNWEGTMDAAIDALVVMQRAAPVDDLPPWDAPLMTTTACATLLDWWWPAMFSAPAPDAARAEIAAALTKMLVPVAVGPRCFVHRDFFAGNLVWLPARDGVRRVGLLDFQGAAVGHPAYDLVSLIEDARRDFPPALTTRVLARYRAARPEFADEQFEAAYIACAAQRHLRVTAQWVRLARRDGRPGYLIHGARTWRRLAEALAHPAAAPLAQALDRWIPAEFRRNPMEDAA